MAILDLQKRNRELGRIRTGDKGSKGQPQKLEFFRLTSANRRTLDQAAALWGGEVREWEGEIGQYELYTKTTMLPILLPVDTEPVSQFMEQWKAGGCTHRCDTVTNAINGEPCSCNPENRACKATTRLNVLLPDLPGIGVWRLESHGWNAALELPSATDMINRVRDKGSDLPGVLRLEQRTSKKDGKTMHYAVPVIDLDVTVAQLMSGRRSVREIAAGPEPDAPTAYIEDEPEPDVLTAPEIAKLLLEAGKLGASESVVTTLASTTLGCRLEDVLRSDKAKLWNAVKAAMVVKDLTREFDATPES